MLAKIKKEFEHLIVLALVQYSALMNSMSGKLNGSVHSHNLGGNYLRNKGVVANPNTSYQQATRSQLAYFSQNWRALTAIQQAAWNAAAGSFPYTNVFGETKYVSGKTLYVKLNCQLAAGGASALTSPPLPGTVTSLTALSLVATVAGQLLPATFTATPVPAGYRLLIYATPALSPGITFVKNRYRLLMIVAAAGTSPQDIRTAWIARFGSFAAGQKIYIRGVMLNTTTGQVSVGLEASAIAA